MQQIPLFEVKNKLSFFVDLAEQGERIEITRHGKSVAAIVNTEDASLSPNNEQNPFYLAYLDLQKKIKKLSFSDSEWDDAFNIPRSKSSVRHSEDYE